MFRTLHRTLTALAAIAALCGPCLGEGLAPELADWYGFVGNGDFEQGDALPEFWRPFPPDPQDWGNHRLDGEVAHSGQYSGLLTSTAEHPPGKAQVQWNHYGIPVEGGGALIVGFWVKTDGVFAGGAGCHFYDAEGAHLGFAPTRVPRGEAPEWTFVRGQVTVPEAAVSMGVALYGRDLGRTWYDDISVLGTPHAEAVRATPEVDGKLTDACWAADSAISRFALASGEGLATAPPEAWVACDDDALYFAFRCPVDGVAASLCSATEHDGPVFDDESIQIAIDPGGSHDTAFRISVNARGVVSDAHDGDAAWKSGARVAVMAADGEWTAEVAVPYDSLGVDMHTAGSWGVDLARHDRSRDEIAIWSLGGLDDPARLGSVAIAADLSRFYPAHLARLTDTLRSEIASLRDQSAQAGISGEIESLTRADADRASFSALGEDAQALANADWDDVRARFAQAEADIAEARTFALNSLFDPRNDGEAGGFRVAIASSLVKIPRSEPVNNQDILSSVRLVAAGDESESAQIVVVPDGGPLSAVSVEAGPLVGPGDAIQLTWRRVAYVETAEPSYAVPYVGWWPDPLLPPAPFDVAADHRQPIWLTVDVPPDAAPGVYTGEVAVRHAEHTVAVPVELTVRSFSLPRPGRLATPFGIYASALSHWWWGKQSYRENMPIEMYARWCEFMGRYRLSPKNIARDYITQTNADGLTSVDMSALDQTLRPLADKYFAPYSFCMHRLPSAAHRQNSVSGTVPEVAAEVTQAFAREWEKQGLPGEAYIYGCDEPKPEDYDFLRETYARIKEVAPGYPIMQTIGAANPVELVGFADIWCPLSSQVLGDFYQQRRAAGDTLWTYVCCSPKPPHANFFIDLPATDHRVLFWQTRQAGATGFLFWCVCWWYGLPSPADGQPCFPDAPVHMVDTASYNTFKSNGDGLLLWPGNDHEPLASLRLEVIRDGIEDYEYLALLSELLERAEAMAPGERPDGNTLARARELCLVPETISQTMTVFTTDPAVLLERRSEVGDMIEVLAAALGAH